MESMWKGKHIEGDESMESMESLEHIESMDSMRSMQPVRHKKISRGSMSSMESMWQMMMKEISDEQKMIVAELEKGKEELWFWQIIIESLDMEKVANHENTQMLVTELVHMAAMVVEQK